MFLVKRRTQKNSGARLARALGIPAHSLFSHGTDLAGKIVINWGLSYCPNNILNYQDAEKIYNRFFSVNSAVDKINTLHILGSNSIPTLEGTKDRELAGIWNREFVVFARKKIRASAGAGIVVVLPGEELPEAPLYTKEFPKTSEFRVHVFNKRAIDITIKRKRLDSETETGYVRNLANGWVYCRERIFYPQGIEEIPIASIEVLGLDFGAVDLLYNRHNKELVVCEVNTAPGLVGTTFQKYMEAIKSVLSL